MMGPTKNIATATMMLLIAAVGLLASHQSITPAIVMRRSLLSAEPPLPLPVKKYRLPEQAQSWCEPSVHPPLNYQNCNHIGTFNQIPFIGGMTNGLKMILLTALSSFEKNRCFFITEDRNPLLDRDDKSQQVKSLLARYFEPIGLSEDDPLVQRAKDEGRVYKTFWRDFFVPVKKRRLHGMRHNITSLGYQNIESTVLKKVMLQRLWRMLPGVRDDSCTKLESHGLEEEYLAFSVRRGDKSTEGFEFTKSEEYIDAAEKAIVNHFNGVVPKIFVATDDCAVMKELRFLRPSWQFTSECDRNDSANGFVIRDMRKWSIEQTDEHFRKFFVELIGLAGAKFYIGVGYTNVAWWTAYMRPYRWSHQYLDMPSRTIFQTLDVW